MKTVLRNAFVVLVVLVPLIGGVAACQRPQKSNWRTPLSSQTPCASDAECAGGSCAIEMGATMGVCAPVGGLVPLGGDGGVFPGPDVKPSPSDIQI